MSEDPATADSAPGSAAGASDVQALANEQRPDPTASALGRRLLDAHLASLFAGLTLVFVILKVLAVSRGDTTTALGIVAETGTTSIVAGTLVDALGVVLLAMLSLVTWMRMRPEQIGSSTPYLRGPGMFFVVGAA